MTSAQYCGFYYFGDKGADHCGKGDNRNPDGDKEPLKTIEGATRGKVYLRDDLCPFNVSSFLDLYAHNLKVATLTFWKGTQDHHSLRSSSPYIPPLTYTVLILASSTPEAREHIKLLDRLSEPSSKLIHRISHPSEEETSSEPNNSCFICIRVHSFAVCNPLFCKKASRVNIASENSTRK